MKKKILFVLCLLVGLMFINAGLNHFFNYMPAPKDMPEKMAIANKLFVEIGWLIPLVGYAEISGGLLLIFARTRALGAIIIAPVLTGILLTNISAFPAGLPVALAMVAILVWAIIDNWHKYLPMVRK